MSHLVPRNPSAAVPRIARGFKVKIANFSRLHCLAIPRKGLSTKKAKQTNKNDRKLRSHARILRYRTVGYCLTFLLSRPNPFWLKAFVPPARRSNRKGGLYAAYEKDQAETTSLGELSTRIRKSVPIPNQKTPLWSVVSVSV